MSSAQATDAGMQEGKGEQRQQQQRALVVQRLTDAVCKKWIAAVALAEAAAATCASLSASTSSAVSPTRAKLLMLLDYDGTLTPIVPDPAHAHLSDAARNTLVHLAKSCRVCIVTGRKYDTIRGFVDVPNVEFATSHGMQVWTADGTLRHEVAREYVPMLLRFETLIRERLSRIPGVRIENNVFCISVHYRDVSEQGRQEVETAIMDILCKVFAGHLVRRAGHLVHEIRPDYPWHKGAAVRWLTDCVAAEENATVVPIFVGDDVTDEDAFGELQHNPLAVTVQVHSPQAPDRITKAQYRLEDPEHVMEWLRSVTELIASKLER